MQAVRTQRGSAAQGRPGDGGGDAEVREMYAGQRRGELPRPRRQRGHDERQKQRQRPRKRLVQGRPADVPAIHADAGAAGLRTGRQMSAPTAVRRGRAWRRAGVVVGVLAVAGATAAAAVGFGGADAGTAQHNTLPPTTAQITKRTLVAAQKESGTHGYGRGTSV